jgi:hypothetical protein
MNATPIGKTSGADMVEIYRLFPRRVPMAVGTTTKSFEMLGIGCEIGNTRIHDPTCLLHQPGEAAASGRGAWRFEDKPQAFLDQVGPFTHETRIDLSELATNERIRQ